MSNILSGCNACEELLSPSIDVNKTKDIRPHFHLFVVIAKVISIMNFTEFSTVKAVTILNSVHDHRDKIYIRDIKNGDSNMNHTSKL